MASDGTAALEGAARHRRSGRRSTTYQIITNLTFDAAKQFEDGVAMHGEQTMGDIPNYTDIQPTIQISEVVSEV